MECHRSQLSRIMLTIGLMQNKLSDSLLFIVEQAIQDYFSERKIVQKAILEKMSEENSMLIDDEEMLVVKT